MMFSSPALFQREQKTRVNIRYALTVYSSSHLSTWGKKARLKDVFFMPMALYLGRRKQFPRRGLEELQSRHVSLACTSVASHYTSIDKASSVGPALVCSPYRAGLFASNEHNLFLSFIYRLLLRTCDLVSLM